MKRRIRKIVNFFAFNLLFFALYLNFIHKDKTTVPGAPAMAAQPAPAFGGTVLVETSEETTPVKQQSVSAAEISNKSKENQTTALRLSIN